MRGIGTYRYSAFLILTFVLFSCHKEKIDEPPIQGVPVFKVDGLFGNQAIHLSAGEDNYVLSSFLESSNGVEVHCGELSGGDFSVTLKISDGILDLPNGKFQDLLPGALVFTPSEMSDLFEIDLEDFPNHEHIEHILWYLDGAFFATDELTIEQPGKYELCADIFFENGENVVVCNEVFVGYKSSGEAYVHHFVDQQSKLHAWVESYEKNIAFVNWFMDGELVNSGESLIHPIDASLHKVMAEIHFTNGAVRKKTVLADGDLQGCFLNDFTIYESIYQGNKYDFNAQLEINHLGEKYSTLLSLNDSAEFTVNQCIYYAKNSAGKSVYKISAHLDCVLSNSSGVELPFVGDIVFGIPGE
jgi:hypothetical protein